MQEQYVELELARESLGDLEGAATEAELKMLADRLVGDPQAAEALADAVTV